MEKKYRAKKRTVIRDISYSVGVGCCFQAEINPQQIWTAKKSGNHYILSRKSAGYTLRVTYSILIREFEEVVE